MIVVRDAKNEHDECLLAVLNPTKLKNIKFDERKLQCKKKDVVYCDMKLSAEDMQADQSKAEALQKMPHPKNKRDVQCLFGIVIVQVTESLIALVGEETTWFWNKAQSNAINTLKDILSSDIMLKYCDEAKPIIHYSSRC